MNTTSRTTLSCLETAKRFVTRPEAIVCIDIETTGLQRDTDEILSAAVINGAGDILYYEYIKPIRHTEWPDAEAVNGISPKYVADRPTMETEAAKISHALKGAEVIMGYNHTYFDLPFMRAQGIEIPDVPCCDVMHEYSPIAAEWDEEREDWRWQRLTACAEHYGIRFTAHNCLEDARATLFCYRCIADDQSRIEHAF